MGFGTYRWTNDDGTHADIAVDSLPTTTKMPNIPLPNLYIKDGTGELVRAASLPGLYVDPAEYAAARPGAQITLYLSTAGDNDHAIEGMRTTP